MYDFLKQVLRKWDDWCGDREMEMSIRRHLTDNGYFGGTAQFQAVRLVAVARPGWKQIYRFEVRARVNHGPVDDGVDPKPIYHDLFGLVQDDARHGASQVRVFDNEAERRDLFRRWSDGLICLRGAKGIG